MSDPTIILRFENKTIPDYLLKRLLSWEYEDYEKMDKLTLVFDNMDLEIGDSPELEAGILIELRHGYTDDISKSKYFTIVKVEGWKEIEVTANEVINIFNTEAKTRAWMKSDLETVVSDIAGDNKLKYITEERKNNKGEVLKFDYFQPHIEDLSFLYTLGKHIGYEVWIEEDILYFMPRMYWQKPYMSFVYQGIEGNVLDFKPKSNTMNRRGQFSGGGVDLEKKQTFFYTERGETRRVVHLGKNLYDFDKINSRYKKLVDARLVRVPMRNIKEAEDILAGKWIKEMEDQITAELHLIGEPKLQARRVIEVHNVGKYSGKYYVKKVIHNNDGGYTTVAELTRNSSFDYNTKYSKENINSLVNKNRMSVSEFLKQTRNSPKGKFYIRFFK